MDEVKETLRRAASELFGLDVQVELGRPDEKFGDYATNLALQLAPKLSKTPREIADQLRTTVEGYGYYEKVEVAGPGFLNITLKDMDIWQMADNGAKVKQSLEGQEVLVEYGDPNPFKEMHIGHLYSYITGDAIAKLFESQGATVHRLSYHGDVGLHVAKAIWAAKKGGGFNSDDISIGQLYAQGAKAYEEDEQAKEEINQINRHVYEQDDDKINQLYSVGKQKSFDYFNAILKDFEIKSYKPYFESQSAPVWIEFVKQNTGTVFTQSDGAVVYEGEKKGLHTRVFITSKGLPTYEAKDLGLAELKNRDFPDASRSIIITANEQSEYFKVMLAALSDFDKPLAAKTTHISHGFVSLSTGKMSSRTGKVYGAVDLMEDVRQSATKKYPEAKPEILLAAVKYGFLKHRLGSDLTYDVNESVSIEGNSGPYLQYAYARANSILQKVTPGEVDNLDVAERSLARKISEYAEVVTKAADELMPHYVCTYLYELAQAFNRFYEGNRVAGDSRESTRASLVKAYADTLRNGLSLLNIDAPERV